MGYTYNSFVVAARTLVVSQAPDSPFDNILPSAIDYSEQRIYRELNLLSTNQVDTSQLTTTSVRTLTIPSSFVVVNSISLFTPAGSVVASGSRHQLVPVSREVVDFLWPNASVVGTPDMFAMQDQWTVVLGPSPDGAYRAEVVGTTRPAALSNANQTTFLSERLPDLFMAGAMIFMSMYMRNFASAQGQSGSDPLMSGNWEAQYQLLRASAETEEARKHFWASSWSSYPVSNQAQPQRG